MHKDADYGDDAIYWKGKTVDSLEAGEEFLRHKRGVK